MIQVQSINPISLPEQAQRRLPSKARAGGFTSLQGLGEFVVSPVMQVVSATSAAAMTYHGYKRTESIGWALGWSIFGGLLPFFAVPVALAQGFGQPE